MGVKEIFAEEVFKTQFVEEIVDQRQGSNFLGIELKSWMDSHSLDISIMPKVYYIRITKCKVFFDGEA